jgi:hypothetical protein
MGMNEPVAFMGSSAERKRTMGYAKWYPFNHLNEKRNIAAPPAVPRKIQNGQPAQSSW